MMGDELPAAGEDLHRPCLEMSDGKEQTKFMSPRMWEATLVLRLSLLTGVREWTRGFFGDYRERHGESSLLG